MPSELTRLSQFMADCMSVGALKGFKYFSVYIRSREEIILRVYREQKPKLEKLPISSLVIHDNIGDIHAMEESKQQFLSSKEAIETPFDFSEEGLPTDKIGINFLIAGYQKYRCPYVWLRTNQEDLIHVGENQKLEKDSPLQLESVACWRQYDIRPWDVLVEVICTALDPPPENPFSIDYNYFESITIEERAVVLGAMLEFLRRVYLRHYFFSDIVLEDIRKLQRQHFNDINTLREFQANTGFREASS